MRADEFKLVEGCLAQVVRELRSEYVEALIDAVMTGNEIPGDTARIRVLEDVTGMIAARAVDWVPKPETENE